MDIFNRPHSIAEDTLHFAIYPPPNKSDKVYVTTFAACINDYVDSLLPGFIWHRDGFDLKLNSIPEINNSWFLDSHMRVGDCVDDEWLTVWVLRQISAKWDAVISIYDFDGDFLLIESAEALPTWVTPTNSENRVWIYGSRLHLIPLLYVSPPSTKRIHRQLARTADNDDGGSMLEEDDTFISVDDAIKLIRNPLVETLCPIDVENLVWKKIASYPEAIKSHIHVTNAYLPLDVAKSIAVNPSLVQKAVEIFYTRDAIQLKAANRMSRFVPNSGLLTSVKMTRTAYAQLVGQKFFPPKIFGYWKEKEGTKEWRWRDVGMKLAVGFEMLYQESKVRGNNKVVSSDNANISSEVREALVHDSEYRNYIQHLISANYFKGEIKGSEKWNSFENKAMIAFVEVRRTSEAYRQPFGAQVDAALSNYDLGEISPSEEDSDEWLNIDAQEFEQMMESTFRAPVTNGKNPTALDPERDPEDRLASEQAEQLTKLASKVEDFIEGEGDMDGALFDDENVSDDNLTSESDGEMSDSDSHEEHMSDSFGKREAMEKLVPPLDPSDYGKMPASFHSNSQRVTATKVANDVEGIDGNNMSEKSTAPSSTTKPIRPPIITRDRYDGVDSDDETDEENQGDGESEEDRPQIVGEIDIDMEEEEEEFLEFSREALGISDAQWLQIVRDRQDRGVFLPISAKNFATSKQQSDPPTNIAPPKHVPRVPESGPRPNVNPKLDSFETVMNALDEVLSRQAPKKSGESKASKGKGKEKMKEDLMDVDQYDSLDIDAAMDAELKESLLEEDESDSEQTIDYNLIKNFLESYKSQEGLSGPFSILAGRLQPGFKLPREEF